MAFLKVRNLEGSVWDENPHLLVIPEFKELIKEEGLEKAGHIIMAIYHVWDPKSKLFKSGEDREEVIQMTCDELFNDPDFDLDQYSDIKDVYLKHNTSVVEKELIRIQKDLENMDKFFREWTLDKSDINDRIKAMKSYTELVSDYNDLREQVMMEEDELEEMAGGYVKSFLEKLSTSE